MVDKLFYLLLLLPSFVAGFAIHEFAHAWTAYKLGDDTAEREGRLTLDPVVHIDPFGFLIIVVAVLFNLPLIGWAKPVPVQPRNLSNPQRDSILVAIAGPISNILQAIFWLICLFVFRLVAERMGIVFDGGILDRSPDMASIPQILATIMTAGVLVNVGMAVFNMLPIPPLDGHWVLEGLGPPFITDLYNMIRPWSYIVLLIVIQLPVTWMLFKPFYELAYDGIALAMGWL